MESQPLNIVVAFVRPSRVEMLTRDLNLLPGFPGMSLMDARGLGTNADPPCGETESITPLEPYARLEIVCRGSDTSSIIHTIQRTAHTGRPGDGKLFVLDVAWAVRIRTNEIGDSALLEKASQTEE